MRDYVKSPMGIEEKSFEIIGEEMAPHNFTEEQLKVVKRVIHTTADFDYQNIIHFSEDAINKAKSILKEGKMIYTDTNMALSGISKPALKKLNCNVECFVAREDVKLEAKEKGITRSMAGVEKAVEEGVEFFVFGNAPTAIFKLLELVDAGKVKPKFVVGAPVGFVGAKESKELLEKYDIPYITIRGRKGGSAVAASIMNAIMYMMVER
ncbi:MULTISPECIES: precorrin-8X methylmutase [Clostridium]|uniref:Precorrin-8X methylmutase n=1 Tax=Clostridium senegalense TaxID=1465809 RepID=A0A6M0H4J9_9CLOT|nr:MULTISPECIES: precorrin-8X methylmutase [Clostridium]MBU5227699.1 precorrin-8X methylmutase [Clostridium senegalense]NEU05164.1 precorrin-8X methylmutase [Clostridium senegalense]